MLRDVLFVASNDLRHLLRRPQVWLWSIVLPIFFSYVVGSLMPFASSIGRDRIGFYAAPQAGFLAEEVARRISAAGFEVVRVKDPAALRGFPISLAIPAGFTDSVLDGPSAEADLSSYSYGIEAGYDRYRAARALYGILGDLVVLSKLGGRPEPSDFARLAAEPRKISLKLESAGRPRVLVLGFQQSVPGFIVMFTMLVSLNAGAMLLVAERRAGIFRRLASSAISRQALVAGKLAAQLTLGLMQVAFAMLTGKWLFHIYWGGPSLWAVVLLLAAYAAFCAALSLLMGVLARTEGQSQAMGTITVMVLAALGGCWWPIEITPAWMRQFSMLLPTGWTMNGLHRLLSYGDSPSALWPELAALLAATAATAAIAAKKFRFE
jgi:ABC-type Na+ efflux pump permease subunit